MLSLASTVHGQEQDLCPVAISGASLTVKTPQADFPYDEVFVSVGVAVLAAVFVV
jgi:hypothetical protein